MATTKATASTVSRLLSAAGHPRARWMKSARVKGWGNWSAGLLTEQLDADVRITWIDGGIRISYAERRRKLTLAQESLEVRGYKVTWTEMGALKVPALSVTKKG